MTQADLINFAWNQGYHIVVITLAVIALVTYRVLYRK